MRQYRLIYLLAGWLCWVLIACSASSVSPAPTPTHAQTIPTSALPTVAQPSSPASIATETAPTQPAIARPATTGFSIRLFGSSTNDQDRIKIPLGTIDSAGRLTSSRPVNAGGDMTIEFWMKANAADNTAPDCDGWYYGNIVIDRDIFGEGDYGDYGIAICDGKLVVGVSVGSDDRLLKGTMTVTDGAWHHIAVTRASSGQVRLFVDGQLDGAMNGPDGRIDYRLNRTTSYPNSDPYLVLGAEKHDYPGSRYFNGWLDDVRLSRIARYSAPFTRPDTPHQADADTLALYRFDEGSGTTIGDSATGGQSPGELKPRPGGADQHWSNDTPFTTGGSPLVPRAYLPLIMRS
ncbi:LamG domain-containing protein [Chloroflexus sp.]|uniref:LamG domain-containing protein n=1 Tax=Chloroflexus sp. TaxID=1904827 RepID=UPI002612EE86|nr:LamG domain-containing protein [uncultured Chloroflexus sp.]